MGNIAVFLLFNNSFEVCLSFLSLELFEGFFNRYCLLEYMNNFSEIIYKNFTQYINLSGSNIFLLWDVTLLEGQVVKDIDKKNLFQMIMLRMRTILLRVLLKLYKAVFQANRTEITFSELSSSEKMFEKFKDRLPFDNISVEELHQMLLETTEKDKDVSAQSLKTDLVEVTTMFKKAKSMNVLEEFQLSMLEKMSKNSVKISFSIHLLLKQESQNLKKLRLLYRSNEFNIEF